MFQKILFKISTLLGRLYGKFNNAYNETYSDKKTGECANKTIEEVKKQNKKKYIKDLALYTYFNPPESDKRITMQKAVEFAEFVFEQEKAKGNFDELNNYIGEEND